MSQVTISIVLTMLLLATSVATSQTVDTPKKAKTVSETTQRIDIRTSSGVTYTKCKITKTEPDGISVLHSKGVAKIPFTNLSREYQKKFNYDPTNATVYAKASAKKDAEAWNRIERERAEAALSLGDSMAKTREVKAFGQGDTARKLAEKGAKDLNDRDGKKFSYYAKTDNGTWCVYAYPRNSDSSPFRSVFFVGPGTSNPFSPFGDASLERGINMTLGAGEFGKTMEPVGGTGFINYE